jgi:hypothetical protein
MTAGTSIRRLVEAGLHLMSEGAPGQAMHEFAKLKQIAERFRRYEANCLPRAHTHDDFPERPLVAGRNCLQRQQIIF